MVAHVKRDRRASRHVARQVHFWAQHAACGRNRHVKADHHVAVDGKAHATEYAVRYGVQPIPHVLLAGPDGKIVAVNPTAEKLEAEIKRLLKL